MAILVWAVLLFTGVAAGFAFYFVYALPASDPGATSKRRVAQGIFPLALGLSVVLIATLADVARVGIFVAGLLLGIFAALMIFYRRRGTPGSKAH
jgi:hypothetical protein